MSRENLPLVNYGTKFDITQLPNKYTVKSSDTGTYHICHDWNRDFHMTLCGRTVDKETHEEVVPNNWFCNSCLDILNTEMSDFMFDSVNREYYDPT